MRILFLTDNFPPEVNAPANRTYEHCREWVKQGVEVTVITGVPNFPKGKVYPGYKNKLFQKEVVDGIIVIRVWTYITANKGFFRRLLDYMSFGLASFWAGLFVKTDIIIATSPQFFTAVSGSVLAFFRRKKWVMEVRDLWPESIVAVGAMKKNWLIRLFEKWEIALYRSAYHIIVVTDTFKTRISDRGISMDKISVFKNGVDLQLFTPGEKPADLLDKYDLKGKFIFGYIGTHGMAHGLDFILKCAIELQQTQKDSFFLFLGDGAEKQNLIAQAEGLELKNVLFLDSKPKAEAIAHLKLVDVALVNLRKSTTFQTVIPSKMFEAAALRKPILLGLQGESQELIENFGAGISFLPEDRVDFLRKIKTLKENKEIYRACELGGENLAKEFDRSIIAKKMLDTLMFLNRDTSSRKIRKGR
ncbi:glycosyltransferase family 4 protein [Algoriphagus sp. NG3]|uniref:glycosyltransferase family 4 protein n=1 Tax=Algoriphagus sp. NG3 TaxID=3097546 RepID=UPI002A810686|nr:glycosyltransferase family 4 protein [Algoriphagus sp. NG3]WPR77819.1 glycosyltransferase family 4 protein [Algoriphagus sp. NG3]